MRQIPVWREQPEPVWINCHRIDFLSTKSPDELNELLVRFKVNGEEYVAIVLERFVNRSKRGLQGVVVAEYNGDLLVDLPTDTFTSGSRILVPAAEKDRVLTARR